jgi:hypothetical protein
MLINHTTVEGERALHVQVWNMEQLSSLFSCGIAPVGTPPDRGPPDRGPGDIRECIARIPAWHSGSHRSTSLISFAGMILTARMRPN